MFDSYFNISQQIQLVVIAAALLYATILELNGKSKIAFGILLAGAFLLRLFFALLDPFLNCWDEIFHAVVAKHLGSDPFTPILHTTALPSMENWFWIDNHVWMHKQPLFLWIMAIPIKIFGPTVFAARIPGVILSTASVFFIHRIIRAWLGPRVAFFGAFLMVCSNWLLSLVNGTQATDHNDTFFTAFVWGSIWAWHRFQDDQRIKNALLIGAFAGCAVMTKWLTGFVVFGGWAAVILLYRENRLLQIKHLAIAFSLALLIVMPWQIMAYIRFPYEMSFEQELNRRHLFEAVEGHAGSTHYHFEILRDVLYPFEPWILGVLGIFALLAITDRKLRVHAFFTVAITYAFFSWAATKMPSYTLFLMPYWLCGPAYMLDRMARGLPDKKLGHRTVGVALLFLGFIMLEFEKTQKRHTDQSEGHAHYGPHRRLNILALEKLDLIARTLKETPSPVVFGLPFPHQLGLLYFNGIDAYNRMPSKDDLIELDRLGHTPVILHPDKTLRWPSNVVIIRSAALKVEDAPC